MAPSVLPTSPQPKSPSPSADLTWLLALQQAEHQAGEPRAVRVWAQGGEPHLPIKAWLVGRHDRGWPAQVSRLVHELDLLHRHPPGFTRAAEPGFPPPQPHSRGPPTRGAPQVHSLSSGAHRSCPPAPPQAARPDQSSVEKGRRSWPAAGAPRRQTGGGPQSRGARGWRVPRKSTAPGGKGQRLSELLQPPPTPPLPVLCEVLPTRLTRNMATVAEPKMDSWTAAQSFHSHPRTWVHLRGGEPRAVSPALHTNTAPPPQPCAYLQRAASSSQAREAPPSHMVGRVTVFSH